MPPLAEGCDVGAEHVGDAVRLDASSVGVDENVGGLNRIVLRHTHLSEDVFDGRTHIFDLDMHSDVVWDVKSFEQSDLPFANDVVWGVVLGTCDADHLIGLSLATLRLDLIESKVYKCGVQNRT